MRYQEASLDEPGGWAMSDIQRRYLDERKRELAGDEFMAADGDAENWIVHNVDAQEEVLVMFRAALRFAQSPRSPEALHALCNAVEAAKDAYANDNAERFHDDAWADMLDNDRGDYESAAEEQERF